MDGIAVITSLMAYTLLDISGSQVSLVGRTKEQNLYPSLIQLTIIKAFFFFLQKQFIFSQAKLYLI